jgi:hypothetical protein
MYATYYKEVICKAMMLAKKKKVVQQSQSFGLHIADDSPHFSKCKNLIFINLLFCKNHH